MASGLYLYCVAEGTEEEDLGIKGLGSAAVFTLSAEGLLAVLQECDKPFSSEDQRLVSEWILAHQAVIDLAWERFETVLPFSFDTIVVAKEGKSPSENLREWLARESSSLRANLEKLEGRAEFGVQISWDPTVVGPRITKNDEEIQALQREIQSKSPGTAYLMRQKLQDLLRQRLESGADAYFKEFFRRIRDCVEAALVEKVRKEEPPRQMIANLSCLTRKEDASRLGQELEKIGRVEGFFVRFTGPWPPYSFVTPA